VEIRQVPPAVQLAHKTKPPSRRQQAAIAKAAERADHLAVLLVAWTLEEAPHAQDQLFFAPAGRRAEKCHVDGRRQGDRYALPAALDPAARVLGARDEE